VAASDWYREVRDQNDYLRKQLVALHRGPRARWIKFRLLEVVCRDRGDAIVEVMATDPYPVVRYRRTEDHTSTSTPSGASVAERSLTSASAFRPSGEVSGCSIHPVAPDRG
jgi:hypothetical protein